MLTMLKPRRYAAGFRAKEKIRRRRKVVKTTLGDLVAAVMDEVKSFVRDPAGRYLVASFVVNDILAHRQLRVPKQARHIWQS
ncbi:MAG TPA: hypothetical protein VEG60_27345 [Candidatus Binatia bacterium]|nr:hypothetical protein [Candidatus Binatia bacterium]